MRTAFRELKQRVTSPPLLALPKFDEPFVVETDASNVAVGAVLAQKKEDKKVHPIRYASWTITETEKKYSTCEKEALVVIFALKKFRVYLLSTQKFKLITDHQALQYAFKKKEFHGRLDRWTSWRSTNSRYCTAPAQSILPLTFCRVFEMAKVGTKRMRETWYVLQLLPTEICWKTWNLTCRTRTVTSKVKKWSSKMLRGGAESRRTPGGAWPGTKGCFEERRMGPEPSLLRRFDCRYCGRCMTTSATGTLQLRSSSSLTGVSGREFMVTSMPTFEDARAAKRPHPSRRTRLRP